MFSSYITRNIPSEGCIRIMYMNNRTFRTCLIGLCLGHLERHQPSDPPCPKAAPDYIGRCVDSAAEGDKLALQTAYYLELSEIRKTVKLINYTL